MLFNLVHSILREAESINAYGLFSFFLFFAFFLGILIWAFRLTKTDLKNMGDLPLDAGERPERAAEKIQSEKL
jgi:hypothetical protein